ncbi:MAG: trehalose-phosphatase [Candidatus Sulfotelmatobacter sp.]
MESFLQAVAQASKSLLMLDFDGTLAPFQKNRKKAFPYRGITSLLEDILEVGKTRVVIVSGRDATEIIPLLRVEPHPEIWGLHGLQRVKTDGSVEVSTLDDLTLTALDLADDWLVSQQLQHTAELKAGSIAVHWRGLHGSEAEDIDRRVMRGWSDIAREYGLDLLHFDGGVEIRSKQANKGSVVRTLLTEMSPSIPAAYLGDDTTDEEAFAAINDIGINDIGLSILVRPVWRPTAAQLWLRPPAEVLEFLTRWFEVCLGEGESSDEASPALNA